MVLIEIEKKVLKNILLMFNLIKFKLHKEH